LPGFSGLIVNSTGYSGIELLHMTKAVTLMGTEITSSIWRVLTNQIGAVYDEQLSAKTSVIVCNTYRPAPQKLKFALDRQIPAVHAAWLEDSLSRGEAQPYDAYMINKPALPQKPRQNQVLPSEKHIAPRLGEESSKLHQKKPHEPKMITKWGPPQPRTLDMAMSADLNSTTGTFTNQDNDASFSGTGREDPSHGRFDGHFSLSFQDRVNRPSRRPSTPPDPNAKAGSRQRSSSTESLIRAAPASRNVDVAKETTTSSTMLAPDDDGITLPPQLPEDAGEERDYSDILAKLRANRKAAPTLIDQADEKRRKRRQLGRATSTRSNQSSAEGSGNIDLNDVEDENSVLIQEYQPSQELGWDSPGAAKAREQMIKKLGGTVKERSVPAEGIGVVKDAVGESGLGRTSRRRRGDI
jgi:DNA replication regulator DPB11